MERGDLLAGRYEMVERLGRGGMGEVWAGRDRDLRRDVAVKLLVPGHEAVRELALRFQREAVAAAQINHPRVAALYDRGVHEDLLFLVMEKVDGPTLGEVLRDGGPMEPDRAMTVALGICAALVAAHRAGVIHYDIKPGNVMLTSDGQVKVVDFGIAGFAQTAFTLAGSSRLTPAGTYEYGAPEQFLTEHGDERSDLYALGSVLFVLLTGRPPFTAHHPMALLLRKRDEEAPRLDPLRPGLPAGLSDLVAALLERDPARRPRSAAEVHDRLGRLLAPSASHSPTVRDSGQDARAALRARFAAGARQLATPPPARGTAGGPTEPAVRPPGVAGPATPFAMDWAGTEPLGSYAAGPTRPGRWTRAFLWTVAAAAVVGIPLRTGLASPDAPGGAASAWMLLPVLGGGLCALVALGYLALALTGAFQEARHARMPKREVPWGLAVGPDGIVATGAAGRRAYAWEQVKFALVEEIQGTPPYRYTGLHVSLVSGAGTPAVLRPAGWMYHEPGTLTARRGGRFPVCVLGPMTELQRTALTDAFAAYASRQWMGASFTTLPVGL
ncbi:serine/threonine protein kinase [Streptomyces sp. NBC_00249]|uniref:serine/threonine-protein kinase n=1 Tax=Streptomyces sp. NBC_00249 TaxID=2975690 RepID=UPI00225979C0|nr:serine/threonine-protein kinase [Streptomyces sp. NBC_00249]MCX5197893.1 serine/threonine protein kinase [Streptomyces sp. NBC_00249]